MFEKLDCRYREACKALNEGKYDHADERIKWLIQYIRERRDNLPISETPVTRPAEIYFRNLQSKIIMESGLMAHDMTVERMADLLNTQNDVIENYRYLFFDTSAFKDGMDVADYICSIKDNAADYAAKSAAVRCGFYTVCENLRVGSASLTPEEIYKELVQHAGSQMRQGVGHKLGSTASIESRKWGQMLVALAGSMAKYKASTISPTEGLPKFLLTFAKDVGDIKEIEGDIVK